MKDWKKYQEDTAKFFRSIGLKALTDVTIKGVRTEHDIDVLVTSQHLGFDIKWIIECKLWKKPVNKLHVLGLREIVSDIGADRGILLSESGFQSGAIEAANLTNVQLSSLVNLQGNSINSINAMRLRDLFDRVGICKERYWEISKSQRIECGLRAEWYEHDYSGDRVIEMCIDLLTKAFREIYPFKSENIQCYLTFGKDKVFNNSTEVIELIDEKVVELEGKLDACESKNKT